MRATGVRFVDPMDSLGSLDVLNPGEIAIDLSNGIIYYGDGITIGGRMTAGLPNVLPANFTLQSPSCICFPGGLEIPAGMTFEITGGSVAEVG